MWVEWVRATNLEAVDYAAGNNKPMTYTKNASLDMVIKLKSRLYFDE